MTDYHVIDYATGRTAEDLTAFLNAAGAEGWRLRDLELRRQNERRAVFVKGEAMAEYLVVDYDTGLPASQLEADLDNYGATGWELVHVDNIQQSRRRGILMKVHVTATKTSIFKFSTNNNPPVPNGHIMIDNDDASLATHIYISRLTDGGTDASVYLENLLINDKIYIQDQNNSADYYFFHIVAPITSYVDYIECQVAFDERGIADLANNSTVVVVIGTNVTVGGGGGSGGGGIPDAPADGITYARKDALWNASLALSGDTLDGGNF
jgi:hypothetical protein